jgi:hypothetical protein
MHMVKNMGGVDRGVRALVGLVLIGWGIWSANWWGALGVIPLGTAVVGTCPAYLPFGWKTCRTK